MESLGRSARSGLAWVCLGALLAWACGGDGGATPPGEDAGGGGPADAMAEEDSAIHGAPPRAVLEVVGLDIWAQALPEESSSLEVTRDGRAVATELPVSAVVLRAPQTLVARLASDDHEPLEVTLTFDDSDRLVVESDPEARAGVSVRHGVVDHEGERLPLHTVYLGLRHRWFSAQGRPARRGNRLDFLMNGEEGWSAVHADLSAATDTVHMATWWWTSVFELIRNPTLHPYLDTAERRANTIMGVLESNAADERVIVGQFLSMDGSVSWLTSDDELRAYGAEADDGFEFMGQANETRGIFTFEVAPFLFGERVRESFPDGGGFDPEAEIASTVPPHEVDLTSWPVGVDVLHASWHQKFAVVDQEVAYVGGMNLRPVDWDTSEHRVFDERRMDFGATTAERLEVQRREAFPDNGPRKDYVVRIEGPAVQDVSDLFHDRWSHLRAIGARYSENATTFEVRRDQRPVDGGVQAQIAATMPQPFWEHAIAETWFNAVRSAERYIFVEDQYWRVPMLVDAILERMEEVADLELVVVTKPVSETTDPGCAWTHRTHQALRARFPSRYRTFRLRSFDYVETWGIDETESRFADIDVHSKLLIVDDRFLSVGSANKNNRGIVYEGELTVAVLDDEWVREARRRVIGNMLGPGAEPSDEPSEWIDQLSEAAAWNAAVWAEWDAEGWDISLDGAPLPLEYEPMGFVYPLDFGTLDDCFFETVGPDQT